MTKGYFLSSEDIHDVRIWSYMHNYNVVVSRAFLTCAEFHLRAFFTKQTGVSLPNNKIATSAQLDTLVYGEVSSFQSSLFINHEYLFTKICWRSPSGRIYKMGDEDIDCDDIQFWQEGIDAKLVHQYLHPTFKNPFKLKERDLAYELVITNLAIDLDIEMTLKTDATPILMLTSKSTIRRRIKAMGALEPFIVGKPNASLLASNTILI
jgi:hypothetical protein